MPLVFVVVPDPVGSGLVASLAHPGGNLTGLSFMAPDLNAKRLSLLKEAIPNLSRVGLLQDRSLDPVTTKNNAESYSKAATTMDAGLRQIEVPTPEAIDEAFSAAALDGCRGRLHVSERGSTSRRICSHAPNANVIDVG
jgi:putative tryptophan/tyrosine transport system substrate-binding protein